MFGKAGKLRVIFKNCHHNLQFSTGLSCKQPPFIFLPWHALQALPVIAAVNRHPRLVATAHSKTGLT